MESEDQETLRTRARAGVPSADVSQNKLVVDWLNDLIATNRGIVAVYQTAVDRRHGRKVDAMRQKLLALRPTTGS